MDKDIIHQDLALLKGVLDDQKEILGSVVIKKYENVQVCPLTVRILVVIKQELIEIKHHVMERVARHVRKEGYLCDRHRSYVSMKGSQRTYHMFFTDMIGLEEKMYQLKEMFDQQTIPINSLSILSDLAVLTSSKELINDNCSLEDFFQSQINQLEVICKSALPRVFSEIKLATKKQNDGLSNSLDTSISIFNDFTLLSLGEQLVQLYGETELDAYPLRQKLTNFTGNSHENPVSDFVSCINGFLDYYSDVAIELSYETSRSRGTNRNGKITSHEKWVKSTAIISFLRDWRTDQHFIKELVSTTDVEGSSGFVFLVKKQLDLLDTVAVLLDLHYSSNWSINDELIVKLDQGFPRFTNKLFNTSWMFNENNNPRKCFKNLISLYNDFLNWQGIKSGMELWMQSPKDPN